MEPRIAGDYPRQYQATQSERAHPRYAEYAQWVRALDRQLVTAGPFAKWLSDREREENGHETVYQVTALDAQLKPGWYKNKFAPRTERMTTFGPFLTEAEAQSA